MVEAATGDVMENKCVRVSFLMKLQTWDLFSCEFCEIFKNTLFTEHIWMTASALDHLKINPLMYNVLTWSDTLWKSYSISYKIFKVCVIILGHYKLKGSVHAF